MTSLDSTESRFLRFRQHGDAGALAAVFDATAAELGRVASYLAGDRQRAEDLLQATWLSAMTGAERWDASRPLLPWLLGILANHARNLRRANRREVTGSAALEALLAKDDPLRGSVDGEFADLLQQALAQLPAPFKEVVVLHLQHGLSAKEIGAALGRPAGTVRTQIVRGLDRLRASLPAALATGVTLSMLTPECLAGVRQVLLAQVPQAAATGVAAASQGLRWLLACACLGIATWWIWQWQAMAATPPRALQAAAQPVAVLPLPLAPQVAERSMLAEAPQQAVAPALVDATPATMPRRTITVHVRHRDQPERQAGEMVGLIEAEEVRFLATDAQGDVTFEDVARLSFYQVFLAGTEWNETWLPQRDRARFAHEMTLSVDSPDTLVVTVVDALGRPVSGAAVESNASQFARRTWCPIGVTGADGVLRLRGVRKEWAQLRARASGHAVSPMAGMQRQADGHVCRLQLGGPAASLVGRVVDPQGNPIAAEFGTIAFGSDLVAPWYDRTAADGTFLLDWLPMGRVALVARARKDEETLIGMLRVELPTAERVELKLERGASLRGSTRFFDGSPGGGSQVSLRMLADGALEFPFAVRDFRSQGEGEFSCDGLLPGRWLVRATIGEAEVTEILELGRDPVSVWNAVAPEVRPLRVRLVDPRGKALEDWRVQLCDAKGHRMATSWPTDANGETAEQAVWRLPVDRGYDLHLFDAAAYALHPGIPVWRVPAISLVEEVLEVVVPEHARAQHQIHGLVVDENNQPLPGKVMVFRPGLERDGSQVECDAMGRFAVGPFAPGRLVLRVVAPGRPPLRLPAVEVPMLGDLDLGTLVMAPACTVHAAVAGQAEIPPDLRLELVAEQGGERFSLQRTERGGFLHSALPAGAYRLTGSSAASVVVAGVVQATPGIASTVEFRLERAPVLRILVDLGWEQRAQSMFVGDFAVRSAAGGLVLQRRLARHFRGQVEEPLRFEVALPVGEYTASFDAGYGPVSQRIRVEDAGAEVRFAAAR
jgi:RNA polymerase sigma factor (sigma-70 family)